MVIPTQPVETPKPRVGRNLKHTKKCYQVARTLGGSEDVLLNTAQGQGQLQTAPEGCDGSCPSLGICKCVVLQVAWGPHCSQSEGVIGLGSGDSDGGGATSHSSAVPAKQLNKKFSQGLSSKLASCPKSLLENKGPQRVEATYPTPPSQLFQFV